MVDSRNGLRRFLETQVEGLQSELYALERDPGRVEPLKKILRICQQLRHASAPEEPESARILRNAAEKVTLHLGRAGALPSREFLDFYLETFNLLRETLENWPSEASFDYVQYADRVRLLLASVASAAPVGFAGSVQEPPPAETSLHTRGVEVAVEIVAPRALTADELEGFVEADLRDLLGEPWTPGRETSPADGSSVTDAGERQLSTRGDGEGGLAASFSTYEALRGSETFSDEAARSGGPADVSLSAQVAISRLRDVLDAFSVSLNDLEAAADRLVDEIPAGVSPSTGPTLVERLEVERDKLLAVFNRTVERISESFRAGVV